jgi:hypothetical protein
MKHLLGIVLIAACNTLFSQLSTQTCGQGYFYKIGGCISSFSTGSGSVTGWTQNYPGLAEGLAIGPSFGFSAPDPTYWTVVSGIYYYYNGTGFVSSGHTAGGNGFINPGGSRDFIYNLDAQGNVSVYNGTGNATILASFPALTSTCVVQDIAGDDNNNFYLFRSASPAGLLVFDNTGVITCSYAVSGVTYTGNGLNGLAMTNNMLITGNANNYYTHELKGNTLHYKDYGSLGPCQGQATDLASCPSEGGLFTSITSTPAGLTCTMTSIALTSGDSTGTATYSWSGPGLLGAANAQSITVNVPGTYTRTAVNCAGLISTMYHTVKYDSTPPPLSYYQSAKIKCAGDQAVLLSASGYFTSYEWSPVGSLSTYTASIVYASPSVTTTYSVTGKINGCERTAVITVSASPLEKPVVINSQDSTCSGSAALLNVMPGLNLSWMPGNLKGASVQVSPVATTIYTVTGTDSLGCSESATFKLNVVNLPSLNLLAAKNEICAGESIQINASGADNFVTQPGNLQGAVILVMPAANTVFTVTGSNWICANTKTIEIVVNPLPVLTASAGSDPVCAGDPVMITASGANSYLWDGQAGNSFKTVFPSGNTSYKITGIDLNGCSGDFTLNMQVSECTSIAGSLNGEGFRVFPNPSTGTFKVITSSGNYDVLEVYDMRGKLILSADLLLGSNSVDLNQQPRGLYFVRITSGGGVLYQSRILVQ